ncbi:MAG: SusC/RagA family TonB-linked outer membrane protein [Gemmatimonadaceae bacterium]|nr:SusC/RagA family TonB-linked outer membrane protein [Gemmatimonadaceae bacterium]
MSNSLVRGLLAAATLWSVAAQGAGAQQGGVTRITGRVTDSEGGAPLEGAQVRIDGSPIGTMTSADGRFTMVRVQPGTYQLRVVRIGYLSDVKPLTVTAGQTTTIDFALKRAPYQLEAVVTTATGQQLTRELGNSIAKIDASELVSKQPITSMQDVLNGRTAGVTMIASSGTVGGGARIRVRGLSSASLSNDPLVIIDGVRVEQGSPDIAAGFGDTYVGGGRPNFLNNLNPEEIESMEIVKGPSAATLYGTQSANGVIVITTKKGRQSAPKWQLFGGGGTSENTYDYGAQYYNKGVRKSGGGEIDCTLAREASGLCTLTQQYRRNLLMDDSTTPFKTGVRQNYGAQVSGGTESLRYFVSGTWENEIGVLQMPTSETELLKAERDVESVPRWQRLPNQLAKSSLRGNFGMPVWGNGDLQLSSGFISSSTLIPQTGDNLYGVIGSGLFGTANPLNPAGWGFASPRQAFSRGTTRDVRQFVNSASANWKPRDWLSTRAIVGLDFMNWQDATKIRNGEGCTFCGIEWEGLRAINRYSNERYSVDAGATATKNVWTDFNSKTSIGVQWNRDGRFATYNSGKILPPGGATIDAGAQKSSAEQTTEFVTAGAYIEQQVGWKDKVFVTAAVRRDLNSAFGKNFGAATYPKATVSWVIRDDGAAKWINNFRPRFAWGVSGQQPNANASITYLRPITATLLNSEAPAVTFGALGNNDLKPERSREIEGGFDFTTLRNRISLQVTFYDKRTEDAIVQRNLPPSQTAGASVFDNVGVVSNKGLEVSLNARLLDNNLIQYDAQVEGSWNKNRLESLADGIEPFGGFGYQNAPGRPLFSNYWPNMTGFKDANGDGVIVASEVTTTGVSVYGGPSVPTRTLSLNNTIGLLKNKLRLNGLFDYRGGNVMHQISDGFACALGPNNCAATHVKGTPLREQARAVIAGAALGAYWEKGDFVRLREVSATYTVPSRFASLAKAREASIVLSGRNLWMWTKEFTGADPESQTSGTDATPYSFVMLAQPRYLTFRVNLSY